MSRIEVLRTLVTIRTIELGHAMFWWRTSAAWCGNCQECGREAYVGPQGVTGSALDAECIGFVPAPSS
jgi:hypothetical protein